MRLSNLSTYETTLVPAGTDAEDVVAMADAGMLKTREVFALSSTDAAEEAHRATGLAVYAVSRIEPTTPATVH